MNKRISITLSLMLLSLGWSSVWASDNELIQVPDNCIAKEAWPCLVKSVGVNEIKLTRALEFLTVRLEPKTILKVNSFENLVVIDGGFQIRQDSEQPKSIMVQGIKIPPSKLSYVKKTALQVEILNSANLDLITLYKDQNKQVNFMSRKQMIDFVSGFSLNTKSSKSDLALLVKHHSIRLKTETELQQNQIQRSIASVEAQQKQDAEARQKQLREQKKIKELFFKRTFKE